MLVDTATLLCEPLTLDPIEAQHRTVSGEARPYAGKGVRARKGQQLDEPAPVRLIGEYRRPRLGSGHDQRIERAGQHLLQWPVGAPDVLQRLGRPRQLRQRSEPQADGYPAGGLAQQPRKLAFRRAQCRVRHVIHQRDHERSARGLGICTGARLDLYGHTIRFTYSRTGFCELMRRGRHRRSCIMRVSEYCPPTRKTNPRTFHGS